MTTAKAEVSSVHSPASVSRKKLAANRRNAQKSTGPRTEDGKRVSSGNAIKYGCFSREIVLSGESEREYAALYDAAQLKLRPNDAVELWCVERWAQAAWKLNRAQAADAALHEEAVESVHAEAQQKIERLTREEEQAERLAQDYGDERTLARVREQLGRMRRVVELTSMGQTPPGPILAASMSEHDGGSRDRLSRYEQRVENGAMRAIRMLF